MPFIVSYKRIKMFVNIEDSFANTEVLIKVSTNNIMILLNILSSYYSKIVILRYIGIVELLFLWLVVTYKVVLLIIIISKD